EINASVLPSGLDTGRCRVRLVEQLPGVLTAIGDAIRLGPPQLQIGRRSDGVVDRDRTAVDRFIDECRNVRTDHHPAARGRWIMTRGKVRWIEQFRIWRRRYV